MTSGNSEFPPQYDPTPIPSGVSSRVWRLSPHGTSGSRVYYKEYLARSVWDTLKHTLRASRACRELRASTMLAAQGFDVPEIMAVGESRVCRVLRRCFLVTTEIADAQPVYVILGRAPPESVCAWLRQKRDLLRTLGHTVGRMHAKGIVHGDLRPGNILARQEGGSWRLFLLDNERTRKLPMVTARLRRKNLVQVGMLPTDLSRSDRLRFWQAYLSECPSLRPSHKRWARDVYARTAERMSKYTQT